MVRADKPCSLCSLADAENLRVCTLKSFQNIWSENENVQSAHCLWQTLLLNISCKSK